MRWFEIIAPFAVIATAAAAPSSVRHVVHERREAQLQTWEKRSPVDPSKKLPMRIGLKQRNLDKGHDLLMGVSHPTSQKYGQHYSAEEVRDLFAPSEETVEGVREWLISAGIPVDTISQSWNKQWIQFDTPAEKAEQLLKAKYHLWTHEPTGRTNVACDEYSLPAHVREHVDYITPGIKLHAIGDTPSRRVKRDLEKRTFGATDRNPVKQPPLKKPLPMGLSDIQSSDALSICSAVATPECIRALYNFTQATSAQQGNELGIFEDLGDVYAQEDLDLFFASLAPEIPQGTHPTLDAIDGAVAPNPVDEAGPESDLDFQISYPIIYPQNSILFQTDDPVYENDYEFEGFLNNFLDAIDGSYCSTVDPLDPPYPDPSNETGAYKGQLQCGVYKPTNVISISYGGQESDLPASYQQRQCAEYMKLGMQGVSFVISSGDSGVSGRPSNGSNGCLGPDETIFSPDFPVTCPYVTAVGSTFLPPGANVSQDAEVATTRFPSGGGFSNIYGIPDYQSAAVSSYLTNHNPGYVSYSSTNNDSFGANGGIYNSNGRAYPDVSAVGDNVIIFNGGFPTLIGGTSASAPTWGGIVTRLNDERLAAGKTPVGFLNPTLYANPSALHDITVGNNSGCGTSGFFAAEGWDPVTGLGTPNYPALSKVFLDLP